LPRDIWTNWFAPIRMYCFQFSRRFQHFYRFYYLEYR
jgi:hypothetical protein